MAAEAMMLLAIGHETMVAILGMEKVPTLTPMTTVVITLSSLPTLAVTT